MASDVGRIKSDKGRILDVKASAEYLGVCPSIIRLFVKRGILAPLSFPGRTGKRIQKLLFDIEDLNALIRNLKGGVQCQNDEELTKARAVFSNRKDETSGTSSTPLEAEKRAGSQPEQRTGNKLKDSIEDYFQKWKEAYR